MTTELRGEGSPPEALEAEKEKEEAKEEEKERDSERKEDAVQEKKKRKRKKKKATDDWDSMRKAVVEASACAMGACHQIYPDGYWSEDLPFDPDLHDRDCQCFKCRGPDSDDSGVNFFFNTWEEQRRY